MELTIIPDTDGAYQTRMEKGDLGDIVVWGGDGKPTYAASIWSIGNNTLYPKKCMQIISWLHTPEGAMTIWYGIKSLMWDYDANGNTYFTELGKICYFDPAHDLTGTKWTNPYTGKEYTLDGTFNGGKIQANNITWGFGATNPDSNGECFHYSTPWSPSGPPPPPPLPSP